ncbi:MAG: hypothetical protein KAY46_23965 [Burkholderiaceae bacterium]|nr:hypothetical protein [Burkholderiaceae bacterium]
MKKNLLHGGGFALAEALALPGLSIALFCYFVGRVAASGGFLRALFELFFTGAVILPAVALSLVALLAAGLLRVTRPWACAALIGLDVACMAAVALLAPPPERADWAIALPALLSIAICVWLLTAARRAPALLKARGLREPGVLGQAGGQPVVHVGPDAAPLQ